MSNIFCTRDHNKFRKFPGNRTLKEGHVEKLMASIKQCDDLENHPIIVDEDYRVLDGQHRLEAAKRLGLAIYYKIDKDASHEKIIQINDCKLGWNIEDKFEYHIEYGNDDYRKIRDLCKEIGVNLAVALMFNGSSRESVIKGQVVYNLTDKDVKDLTNVGLIYKMTNEKMGGKSAHTKPFARALYTFFQAEGIDSDDLVTKYKTSPRPIRPTSIEDTLRQICDIYNYRRQVGKVAISFINKKIIITKVD